MFYSRAGVGARRSLSLRAPPPLCCVRGGQRGEVDDRWHSQHRSALGLDGQFGAVGSGEGGEDLGEVGDLGGHPLLASRGLGKPELDLSAVGGGLEELDDLEPEVVVYSGEDVGELVGGKERGED